MAAPPLANTFEGGSNGVTITAANSGGVSGNAFDAVTGAPIFTSTKANTGSLSMAIVDPTVLANVDWTGLGSITTDLFIRIYVQISGLPSVSLYAARVLTSTGATSCWIRIRTDGVVIMSNAADTATIVGAVALATNAWNRLEFRVRSSTTVGELEYRLFKVPDSTNPDATAVVTAQVLGANSDRVFFGVVGTPIPASPFTVNFDDVAVSTAGWIGAISPNLVQSNYSRSMKVRGR